MLIILRVYPVSIGEYGSMVNGLTRMEHERWVGDIHAGDMPADMRLNGISALNRRLFNSEYDRRCMNL